MNSQDGPLDNDLFYDALVRSYVGSVGFVERHWLSERIEAALAVNDCRFVLLTGEPGAGKTAFLASLASQHPDRPRFFIRRDSRTLLSGGDARSFLFAVGHQLASLRPALFRPQTLEVVVKQTVGEIPVGGQVQGISVQDLYVSPFYNTALRIEQHAEVVAGEMEGLSVRKLVLEPRFLEVRNLEQLALFGPCRALLAQEPSARVVVLVDALDELRYHRGGDDILAWLANCPELPSNLRLVLSSRDDEEALRLFRYRQKPWLVEEPIDKESAPVQDDVRRYTMQVMSQNPIRVALAAQNENPEGFASRAVTKAHGNFQYLAALSRAIEQALSPLDASRLNRLLRLEEVPTGLQGLYAFFLELIRTSVTDEFIEIAGETEFSSRHLPAWESLYQPILGLLAVAREPLETGRLRNLSGIHTQDRWVVTALGRLRQFLDHDEAGYRLYHSTFAEFLTSLQTQADHPDCYLDPVEWHRRIAGYYRGSARSWDEVNWRGVDEYGLRHLSAHLHALTGAAVFRKEFYALLCRPWMDEKWVRNNSHHAFAADVELAMTLAGAEEPANLVQEIRACLLRATLGSLTTNVPPEALRVLAQAGRAAKALGCAAIVPHASSRSSAYAAIGAGLLDRGEVQEARAALRLALAASDKELIVEYRAAGLGELMGDFVRADDTQGLQQALDMIADMPKDFNTLSVLGGALMKGNAPEAAFALVQQAFATVQSSEDCKQKVGALVCVAQAFAEIGHRAEAIQAATQACTIAEKLGGNDNSEDTANAFRELANILEGAGERQRAIEVVNHALTIAETIGEPTREASVLIALIPVLSRLDNDLGLMQVLATAEVNPHEGWKAGLLAGLARVQTQRGNEPALKRISASAQTIADPEEHARVFGAIAVALARVGAFDRALRLADEMTKGQTKSETLSEIVSVVAQASEFDRALAVTELITHPQPKAEALAAIASKLVESNQTDRAAEVAERALVAADAIRTAWVKFRGDMEMMEVIGRERSKTEAVVEVVRALAESRRFNEALGIASSLMEQDENLEGIAIVVNELADTGEPDDLRRALELMEEYDLVDERPRVLMRAARHSRQPGNTAHAIEQLSGVFDAVEVIEPVTARVDALSDVIEHLGMICDDVALKRALMVAEKVADDPLRGFALAKVAMAFAKAGEKRQALDIASSALALINECPVEPDEERKFRVVGANEPDTLTALPRTPANKAFMLGAVAEGLSAAGALEAATDAVRKAFELTQSVSDEDARPPALAAATQAMAQLGGEVRLELVLAVTHAIDDETARVAALTASALVLARANRKVLSTELADQAKAVAQAIANDVGKAQALGQTAQVFEELKEQGQAMQLARHAFAVARTAGRHSVFKVLSHTAATLAFVDNGETLGRVYAAIKHVDSWWSTPVEFKN